jgi:hypothetical protein
MGLGQDKRVCRRPLGARRMAQVVSEKIEAKDSLNVSPRRYPASLGL